MALELVVVDKTGEFPVVNLAFARIFNDEVQIHQGPAGCEEVPTLASNLQRDVISLGRDQAIELANKIITHYNQGEQE